MEAGFRPGRRWQRIRRFRGPNITGRQGRQPIRATARTEMVCSRWSRVFVKNVTIFEVSGTVPPETAPELGSLAASGALTFAGLTKRGEPPTGMDRHDRRFYQRLSSRALRRENGSPAERKAVWGTSREPRDTMPAGNFAVLVSILEKARLPVIPSTILGDRLESFDPAPEFVMEMACQSGLFKFLDELEPVEFGGAGVLET